MASSHSLLDIGTTLTTPTAAVALMNASEAPVCRCQGWKANLNQSVSKAFVMHLVLWYLGIWVPPGGSLRFQSDEQSARPEFKHSSEQLCDSKSLVYCFDISCFLCPLKSSPGRGCSSDSVTTQTEPLTQGAHTLYFGVLFGLGVT